MTKRALSAGVLAALCGLAACAAPAPRLQLGETADGEVLDVVGEAPLDRADMDGTRRGAKRDALKNAVEMVVGVHLSAKTRVEKAALIESKILSQAEGYVKKYDLLKEWADGPAYKVRLRAYVAHTRVADDLRAADVLREPQVGNPRVAVLLNETAVGLASDQTATYAGDALGQALQERGFRVVDRADLMAAKASEVSREVDKGNFSGVAGLSRRLDAEVLVFGSAEGTRLKDPALGELISYRVSLSAKAYKSQSGAVLASLTKSAGGLDSTPLGSVMKAFANAGKLAGKEMAQIVLEELRRQNHALLTITGAVDLEGLGRVRSVVEAASGVQEVYLRSFGRGEALLEVGLKNSSVQDLAHALERAPRLKAKVSAVTAETIDVALE